MGAFGEDKKAITRQMVPALADIAKASGLDVTKLSVAILCQDADGKLQDDFKRNDIRLYDDDKSALWHVPLLIELCRGDRQPPSDSAMNHYPPEYVPFFACVEIHTVTICDIAGDRTDEEFMAIFNAMRKYPDGKDLGVVHRVIWQCAALAMGMNPYSQEEYEAVFAQLARSARHWRMGASSRNYIAFLRNNFSHGNL